MGKSVILFAQVAGEMDLSHLDGKTFQIHVLPEGRIRLYPVEIIPGGRCPVLVGGEQCGGKQGHEGKHWWSGGD